MLDCMRTPGMVSHVATEVSPPGDGRPRIMVVDDNGPVRETIADVLEMAGFRPIQACSADRAMACLREDPAIAVLVTDLTMPGADGIALIRLAREHRAGLPAILLTGYAEDVGSASAGAGGGFLVLGKPVESDRLIREVSLLVGRGGLV